jgi:hypothetical protein
MKPITTFDIMSLLPENRALVLAKGLGIDQPTVQRAAQQMLRLNISLDRLLDALTLEELRSLCTHRGIAPGPNCAREELIDLALGRKPDCEVAYLPWWSDPNGS